MNWIGVATGLLVAFWGGYLLTGWVLEPLKKTFLRAGFVRRNFRGEPIPVGMGTAVWLGMFVASVGILVVSEFVEMPWGMVRDVVVGLVVGTGFFAVGLLDDAVGNRDVTGLRGHVRRFVREGEVTTGLVKLVAGGVIGLLGAWLIGAEGWEFALQAGVIALAANSVNLLDLRPGRACKGVFLALAVVGFFSVRGVDSPVYWMMIGLIVAYLPEDLGGRVMLGDAGANLLGGMLGVLIVTSSSVSGVVVWGVFFVMLHVVAERYSLTEVIEGNRVLRWLDVLGRKAV